MNYFYQFLIACIPAVISGFVTYSKTKSDSKIKLKELEQKLAEQSNNHKHELEQMKQAHEHQLELIKFTSQASQEDNLQNAVSDMTISTFGSLLNNMLDGVKSIDDLEKLSESAKRINSANP